MGSGFKTFTAGSVLTASDVQNYLQDQAVMVFGGTAARSSAIGTANFEEGMLTYLTDVDKLQVYTGSSFQDVYPPAATSQGMTLINTTSFSGVSSQSFNNVFTSTYKDYFIKTTFSGDAANVSASLRLRASGADNSSAVYDFQELNGASGTPSSGATNAGTQFFISSGGRRNQNSTITFFRPQTNTPTNWLVSTINYNADFAQPIFSNFGALHRNNYQADGFTILFTVVSSGSLEIYGYNN